MKWQLKIRNSLSLVALNKQSLSMIMNNPECPNGEWQSQFILVSSDTVIVDSTASYCAWKSLLHLILISELLVRQFHHHCQHLSLKLLLFYLKQQMWPSFVHKAGHVVSWDKSKKIAIFWLHAWREANTNVPGAPRILDPPLYILLWILNIDLCDWGKSWSAE